MASVGQGRDLRLAAKKLGWDLNREFQGKLVRFPTTGPQPIPIGGPGGMTFTVLGPLESKLKSLQKEWDKQIKRLGLAQALAQAAEYADTSVFNLSSIVVLAESPGPDGTTRRMLLTGDARGDHVLEGLEAANLLKDGTCHVDLLKLPHHGSNRNLEPKFFEQITADHYVVSSNGERFDNPDLDTLEWLASGAPRLRSFHGVSHLPGGGVSLQKAHDDPEGFEGVHRRGEEERRLPCRMPNPESTVGPGGSR
jgi:hypothetical protein